MNPDQILLQVDQLLDRYMLALGQTKEADFHFKPNLETWSIGQLYEHICVSNTFFLKLLNNCLEKRSGNLNVHKTDRGIALYARGQFPDMRIKIPKPLQVLEPEAQSRDSYPVRMEAFRKALLGLKPQLDQDSGEYKISHPVFGFLNALEWFKMIEMHMRHHLRQLHESQERASAR